MPRQQRIKSSTGVYHVTMRGVNKADIFLDQEDYETYLNYLQNMKATSHAEIYAYCLMTNHIHLLIKETDEDLGLSFQRLGAGFVGWYNRKYERVGHLFQNRYGSEVVETDAYLLMVMRYIHQNPVKVGLVNKVAEYPWSSVHEYKGHARICHTELGLSYFGEPDRPATRRELMLAQEYEVSGVHEPGEAVRKPRIRDLDEISVREAFADADLGVKWEERDRLNSADLLRWAEILRRYGASQRQIEQLTNISRFKLSKYLSSYNT